MKILVTAGGTEEPVDGVRRLTNISTGATGGVLGRYFAEKGAEVLMLHAERARLGEFNGERETFLTFADLGSALRRLLEERTWDAVVHLAAVSDYSIASIEVDGRSVPPGGKGKIGTGREVVLRLEANPKLIDSLRDWSRNPAIQVVAFKLTDDPDPASREAQVRVLLARGTADLVVHNDLREIGEDRHPAVIHGPDGPLARTGTKEDMAREVYRLLQAGLD
ncbi:MAG: DNA/pantothenate metabolism flavoprotein [Acidobacteria bacterium]|nr:DNA/pantothenate metabolism flavoprotein [Acidobacteriota bacterium]